LRGGHVVLLEEAMNLLNQSRIKKNHGHLIKPNVKFWKKKICALRDKKNKYSNSCFAQKKISERNKKP
jgi:hypothetical protein